MGGDQLWEAIGAVGQVLGSVAVFATLVYLTLQVRLASVALERDERSRQQ
jgi:hypothetical protein